MDRRLSDEELAALVPQLVPWLVPAILDALDQRERRRLKTTDRRQSQFDALAGFLDDECLFDDVDVRTPCSELRAAFARYRQPRHAHDVLAESWNRALEARGAQPVRTRGPDGKARRVWIGVRLTNPAENTSGSAADTADEIVERDRWGREVVVDAPAD